MVQRAGPERSRRRREPVNEEQSWGAETVALGRRSVSDAAPVEQQRRRKGRRRPRLRRRVLAGLGLGTAVAMGLVVVSGSGGNGAEAPLREVAAPRAVVKPPTQVRRREPRLVSESHVRHGATSRHKPKAGPATHELDEPVAAEPTPLQPSESVRDAPPPPSPGPAPELPPTPTPSAAEFGM